MCGIAGVADTSLSTHDLNDLGTRMLERMSHRGPDHRGTWASGPVFLGHNRLSIIDLSSASHQPMPRNGITITFNGEIYNYLELRQELQRDGFTFATAGDTEVILAAYQRWGEHCVERFIGMWAFAIWDEARQELFCSRDRFGIKPFHYATRDGRLHFGSEVKALFESPLCSRKINDRQVARGLYMGWMHHVSETYFTDVLALPASHNMVWKNGTIRIWQYAQLNTNNVGHGTFASSADAFRELFIDSVRLCARRDVPMGVCLSGGLDSTSIAAVLASASSEHDIKTFTAYYEGPGTVDERPYIDYLLKRYPQIRPAYTSPTDADVAGAIDHISSMMDAPMPSSSYVSQYFVMKLAAENGVKVVLDGQGSDEIMGGYMHSLYRVAADYLRTGDMASFTREIMAHSRRQQYGFRRKLDVMAKSVLTTFRDEPALYRMEFERTSPWIMTANAGSIPLAVESKSGPRLNAFLHNLIYVTLLPTLLHTEDINSMAFSIESRVPFLDHRLVQLCFDMPNDHKVHLGETKRVLRAAMRGLVPDEILDRKDKTGFITPGHIHWLRGKLSYLLDGSWEELEPYVQRNGLQRVLSEYRAGSNRNALFVWRLAMLRLFLRHNA